MNDAQRHEQQRILIDALFNHWQLDPLQATLRIRAYSDALSDDLLVAARQYANNTTALHLVARAVEFHLPSVPAVPERRLALGVHAHSAARFAGVLAAVHATAGESDVSADLARGAQDVLAGRAAPTKALAQSLRDDGDAWRADADAVLRLFGGVPPELEDALASDGLLAAALALPREDLIEMFGRAGILLAAGEMPGAQRKVFERAVERTAPNAKLLQLAAARVSLLLQSGHNPANAASVLLLLDEIAAEIPGAAVLTAQHASRLDLLPPGKHADLALAVLRTMPHDVRSRHAGILLGAVGPARLRAGLEGEPLRSAQLLELALALAQAGEPAQARALGRDIDLQVIFSSAGSVGRHWRAPLLAQLGAAHPAGGP